MATDRTTEAAPPRGDVVTFVPLIAPWLVEHHAGTLAALVYEAGPAHLDGLFGGRKAAVSALEGWARRPNSEFSGLRATLGIADDAVVGATIAMPGHEVPARRRADLLALVQRTRPDERAHLLVYLQQMRAQDVPVEPDTYYIRALAVVVHRRGSGLGRALLQDCIDAGARAGFRRYQLDVRSDNVPALNLYRGVGFHVAHWQSPAAAGSNAATVSMVLER